MALGLKAYLVVPWPVLNYPKPRGSHLLPVRPNGADLYPPILANVPSLLFLRLTSLLRYCKAVLGSPLVGALPPLSLFLRSRRTRPGVVVGDSKGRGICFRGQHTTSYVIDSGHTVGRVWFCIPPSSAGQIVLGYADVHRISSHGFRDILTMVVGL